ncbi:MAG: isochorismate synthase, partial [Chloroflexota bacterium]
SCYKFFLEFEPHNIFIGATPEKLFSLRGKAFDTMALAGSAPRGATPEIDATLGAELLSSEKNLNEHKLVVNEIIENLQAYSTDLQFEQSPKLAKYNSVQHLKSKISGVLDSDYDILDIIKFLHPTPALGGSPKERALEIIHELEDYSRGWYGAPVGWIDANWQGEFYVGIRSALIVDNEARLYAGAGIVDGSIAQEEWDETETKLSPMLNAIEGIQ